MKCTKLLITMIVLAFISVGDNMLYGQYANNNPVNYVDPYGLTAEKCCESKPTTAGTTAVGDNQYDRQFFIKLTQHNAKTAHVVKSGEDILNHLIQQSKPDKDGTVCPCIKTWVHAQHAWSPNSPWGNATNGGFGQGYYGNYRDCSINTGIFKEI